MKFSQSDIPVPNGKQSPDCAIVVAAHCLGTGGKMQKRLDREARFWQALE